MPIILVPTEYDAGPVVMCNGFFVPEDCTDSELSRITITMRKQIDGSVLWSVGNGREVLSKREKDFVWEPQPSSRTPPFIKDTRFASPEKALEALKAYRAKMQAHALEFNRPTWPMTPEEKTAVLASMRK